MEPRRCGVAGVIAMGAGAEVSRGVAVRVSTKRPVFVRSCVNVAMEDMDMLL